MPLRLKMPSTLTLVSIISVVTGFVVFVVSAIFLDAVVILRRNFDALHLTEGHCGEDDPVNLCRMTKNWVVCAVLGILVGLLQLFLGVMGIRMIQSRWKVWCCGHTFVFLAIITIFSWAAEQRVDAGLVEKLTPVNMSTETKGEAFLIICGLDFIFIFVAVIFVLIFASNSSDTKIQFI